MPFVAATAAADAVPADTLLPCVAIRSFLIESWKDDRALFDIFWDFVGWISMLLYFGYSE